MEAASAYSGARATKPGGGGLIHSLQDKSRVDGRVQVGRQRPMEEPDEDIGLHLLHRVGLGQIGADTPILLGWLQNVVVDPPRVWGLQQRMVQQQQETSTGGEYPGHLGQAPAIRRDVLEDQRRHHHPHRGIRDRKVRDAGLRKRHATPGCSVLAGRRTSATSLFGHGQLRAGGIEADRVKARLDRQPGDLTLAAANVQHTTRLREARLDQREDLLDVLGVGPLGELALPPIGMLVPWVDAKARIVHESILSFLTRWCVSGSGPVRP